MSSWCQFMSKMKTVEDASENIDIREVSQQYASGGRQRAVWEEKHFKLNREQDAMGKWRRFRFWSHFWRKWCWGRRIILVVSTQIPHHQPSASPAQESHSWEKYNFIIRESNYLSVRLGNVSESKLISIFPGKENNKSGGTSKTESWEEVDSGILGSLSLPFTIPDDFDFSILGGRNQEFCWRLQGEF